MYHARNSNYKLRIFKKGLCALIAATCMVQSASAVNLYVRDEEVKDGVAPVIENGRTLVPVGIISSILGAEVSWNSGKKQALIQMDEMSILLTIGKKTAIITAGNKKGEADLDVAPSIIEGRTMVPLGFIATYLGSDVQWDPSTKSVLIDCTTASAPPPQVNDEPWGMPSYEYRELTSAEKKMVAADQKKIYDAFKNAEAAKAIKFKKESLSWYYDLPVAELSIVGVSALREKFPGEYRVYGYPGNMRTDHQMRFYINTTTGKIYGDAPPDASLRVLENPERYASLYYEYPSGDLVFASQVYQSDTGDFVIKKLQLLGKLDKNKLYTASVKTQDPESYGGIQTVTVSSKTLGRSTVVGTYEFDPFSQGITDNKGKLLFKEALTDDQSLGIVTEKNAVKMTFQILKKLGIPMQKESAYLFEVSLHDRSLYPDGFDIVFRDKNPGEQTSPVVARYIIQSDGGKLAEYDPVFDNWYLIYGTMSPEG